jgi:hypothetical protein
MATRRDAAKMYGKPGDGDGSHAEAPARSRQDAAKVMYGAPTAGGGYDGALAAYYGRRNAKLRDDAEGLKNSRLEQPLVEAFARKRGISPADLQEALVVVLEHDAHPKSEPVIQKRWADAFEALRLEYGGREPVEKMLRNYVKLTTELAKEVPTLADRAGRSGAANDVRVIKTLAKYGEQQPTVKE